VIDPGHSGRYGSRTDKATGLRDIDYPNFPEIYEMFDVSTCLARALRAGGYRVLLTKRRALSRVGHRERAEIANRSGADLAVSLHDDHGRSARFQATYSQRGVPDGDGRYGPMYRGRGRHRVVFARPQVARASETAAKAIAAARSKVLGRRVAVTQNSFDGRAPLEPGNLALVQLFATVPWVYNEMGARTGGSTHRALSIASERAYAAGLLAGIAAAVPLDGSASRPSPSAKGLAGCLRQQVEPQAGKFSRPRKYLPADL
jgi:N-acetylmuramoyl-L-alanine amidase